MATRSENTPPQFSEKINAPSAKFVVPFRPTNMTVASPYPFMTDVNCAAPVFKPSAAQFVYAPAQNVGQAPCGGQCQRNVVPQQQ